jgi:hypothetical protein
VNPVPIDQNQVFQDAFGFKCLQVLSLQTRGVEARCIVAFSGERVSGSMDRANLESFDLKGYTLIDV